MIYRCSSARGVHAGVDFQRQVWGLSASKWWTFSLKDVDAQRQIGGLSLSYALAASLKRVVRRPKKQLSVNLSVQNIPRRTLT